ncbi:MAG: VCBS repeat-containing protein [Roseibacillus sp.]
MTPPTRGGETRRMLRDLGCILVLLVSSCSEKSPEKTQDEQTQLEKNPNAPFTFRVASNREQQEFEQREREFDPTNDGWNSEAFHGETTAQLKVLAESLSVNTPPSILSPSASATVLRPENLATIFENEGMKVLRASTPATAEDLPLPGQLQDLTRPLHENGGNVSIRFKQFRVRPPATGTTTSSSTVLYKARASSPSRELVQNATWVIDWIYDETSSSYLIESIRPDDFEEVNLTNSPDLASSGQGQTLFTDRTEELIERLPRGGLIHWGANELSVRGLYQNGRGLIGLALGDANGDGIDDIYMPQSRDLPNMLFLSQPDGSLKEVAANSGLNWLDETTVALFADFDNDGDQDLVVGTRERMAIHENTDGSGMNFKRVLDVPQADTSSLAAADYDGDGLLDLYVCNYLSSVGDETVTLSDAVYNALDGGANRLYRNVGNFKFDDVTKSTGMDADATRLSLAASWEDFDNDNDVDLYVANDFGPNSLYLNNGGKFTQVAAEMGADDPSFGMSITWGDINRDGFMDACISNMFSAAGNRITAQPQFEKDLAEGLEVDRIAYLARGNTLLVSKDGTTFDEQSAQAGMVNTQWTWGTLFADFDNSGDLDLMAMNGYVTGPTVDDL